MAAAQNLELTLDMVVKNQGDIATLFKQVDKLNAELKELQKITGSSEVAVRKMGQTVRGGTNPIDALSKSARQNRQAMQMAGMQVGDFATQISTGSNPVQAFNQQIGQLGYALSTSAKPRLAAVGNFLAGPWSIAVLGATMVLGPMIEEMLGLGKAAGDTKKSLSDLVEEKRAAFRQTEVTKQADEAYKKTIEGVREAIEANQKALGELNKEKKTAAQRALEEARANLANIKTKEAEFTATLLNVRAMALAQRQRAISAGAGAEIAAMGLAAAYEEVSKAEMDALKVSMDYVTAMNAVKSAEQAVSEEKGASEEATRGNTRAIQETETELKKFLKSQESYIQSLKDAVNPAGAVQREIVTLNRIFDAGALELDEYNARLKILKERLNALKPLDAKGIDEFFAGERLRGMQLEFQPLSPELQKIIEQQDPYANIKARNEELLKSYEAIGNAVANGFKGMITGAQSFGSAMKSIIQSVIDELFRLYVVQQIVGFVTGALGGIFGGGAAPAGGGGSGFGSPRGFAAGGYPAPGKVALVGERGPELFVPTSSGKIIPNHQMGGGGGMVINVDARGSTDPEAVRQQVQQGILEAAPSIVAAAQNRTMNTLRRPRLAGAL